MVPSLFFRLWCGLRHHFHIIILMSCLYLFNLYFVNNTCILKFIYVIGVAISVSSRHFQKQLKLFSGLILVLILMKLLPATQATKYQFHHCIMKMFDLCISRGKSSIEQQSYHEKNLGICLLFVLWESYILADSILKCSVKKIYWTINCHLQLIIRKRQQR